MTTSAAYYFTDNRNSLIRYVDQSNNIHTLVPSGGDATYISHGGFSGPWGLGIDPTQSFLYLVDQASRVVYKINLSTLFVTTIAIQGGTDTNPLDFAYGDIYELAVDSRGNVAVLDAISETVFGINMNSSPQVMCGVTIPVGRAAWIAGALIGAGTYNTSNAAVAFDASDNLWAVDQGDNTGSGNVVYKINGLTGAVTTICGTGLDNNTGDGGAPAAASIDSPMHIAISSTGIVFIIANGLNGGHSPKIRAVNPTGTPQTYGGVTIAPNTINTVYSFGGTLHSPSNPWAVRPDTSGNLYVCDIGPAGAGCYIHTLSPTGVYSVVAGSAVGTCGLSGNGGAATSALVGESFGVVIIALPNAAPLYKLTGQTSDDNAFTFVATAINSTYTTYGFVNAAKSTQNPLLGFHRKRFSETQMYIKGSGQLTLKAFPNYILKQDGLTFNPYVYTAPPVVLQTDPIDDIVRPLNISGNRVFVMYSTNAVGAAFSISKTILCGNIDSFSTVNPNA